MTEGVRQFLSQLGMLNYYDVFTAKGFDLESDIPYLTSYDLEEVLMITSRQDRAIILSHACTFCPSQEHAIYEWLRSHSLDYYFISFVQSELTDLNKIAELVLPNEDLYDELEIVLPGHRKRLERAVVKLKQDMLTDAKAERPVTFGWWGKPQCLPQAKFDFLCVKASLHAAQEPHKKVSVDFMVDSGSDVSTVQEETLTRLNLELIGPVYSCGIHGGSHTNLYKAQLMIGDQEMEIEVMGSNYDSLGSRVVRHFRHVIDGRRHIWLKGAQTDPLPAIDSAILPQAIDLPGSLQTTTSHSGSNLRALPSTELEDDSHSDQNATHTTQDMPGIGAAVECSVKSVQPRVNARDDEYSRNDVRDVLRLHSEKGLQDSDANRKDHDIHKNCEQPEGDQSMQNQDDNLHNFTSSCSQKSNSFTQNHDKSKDDIIRQAVKRKHSPSPTESEHQTPQSDRQPSREGNLDDSSLTGSSFVSTDAPSSSHTSVPTSERVSLSNLIPPHLRDTDDDIDYMGDTPVHPIPAVWQLPSSEASDNKYNIQNSKTVDDNFLTGAYSSQHHSGRKIKINPNQQFPVADTFHRSVFKGTQSMNNAVINVNSSNICSQTSSSSSVLPVLLSSITTDHASPIIAGTTFSSRGKDDIFHSNPDDIVHIANLDVAEQEEEEQETWSSASCRRNDGNNPDDKELPYLISASSRTRGNIKMTQNFVQAKGGATLIPLDLLENSSNDKSHGWHDMRVTVKDQQLQVTGDNGYHYDLPCVDHTKANNRSPSCKKRARKDSS